MTKREPCRRGSRIIRCSVLHVGNPRRRGARFCESRARRCQMERGRLQWRWTRRFAHGLEEHGKCCDPHRALGFGNTSQHLQPAALAWQQRSTDVTRGPEPATQPAGMDRPRELEQRAADQAFDVPLHRRTVPGTDGMGNRHRRLAPNIRWQAGDFDADGFDDVAGVWNQDGMSTINVRRSGLVGSPAVRRFLPGTSWGTRRAGWQDWNSWCAGDFNFDPALPPP